MRNTSASTKRLWWSLLLAFCLGSILLWDGRQAEAHGYIVRSTPADRSVLERAPNKVQIWFSEGLEREFSTIIVVNQSGEQVDLGDGGVDANSTAKLVVSLPPNLPDGAYLVRMRPVFSSDGHAVHDTLVFWVGQSAGNIEEEGSSDRALPGEVVWRMLMTLAMTVLFGTYFSYLFVLRPAWGNPKWAWGHLPPRVMRWLSFLAWGSLLLAFIANVLALAQVSMALFQASLTDVLHDELWNITLSGTNFGDVWKLRMGLLVVMLVLQIVGAQQSKNRPQSTHFLWQINLLLAVAVLGSMTLISHASGTPFWPGIALTASYLHLISVATWAGSLIVISLILRPALTPLRPTERGEALLILLRRFSAIALGAFVLIIVAGIYIASIQVDRPEKLVNTTYGLTLLAKWVLILPVVGLATIHFVTLSPERLRVASDMLLRIPARLRRLTNTIRLEMLFVLAVLFAAAWLPATPPPVPENVGGELAVELQTINAAGYRVTLSLQPGAIGTNNYDVRVELNGQPAEIDGVKLRFSYPALGRYTPSVVLDSAEPGLWVGASGDVDRAAEWQVLVDLDPPDGAPARAAFRWDIFEEVEDENSRSASPLNILAIGLIGGVAFRIFAVPLVRSAPRLEWTRESILITFIAVGLTIAITAGGAVLFRNTGQQIRDQRDSPPDVVNPVYADEASVAFGRRLYESECLLCHGEGGLGGRPMTARLSRETPILLDILAERGDDDIFRILSSGIGNRHPYGRELKPEAIWHSVNFLRSIE